MIDPSGLILTNFHVVRYNPYCEYSEIGVEFADSFSEAPKLRYIAQTVAFDADLDLAVLKLSEAVDGDPLSGLPAVEPGETKDLDLGAKLRILGYPALGGRTITHTEGAVSGFRDDGDVARAWIKTDATIVGGNSGGLVVDAAGRMVGIPTQASGSDAGQFADCRLLQDTNGDGEVNDQDQCVPLGGFLSLIRPVEFATALIKAADGASPIPIDQLVPDSQPTRTTEPQVADARFGTGIEDGVLLNEGTSLPTGADQVCALVTFSDMVNGTSWGYVWSHDGSEVASATSLGQSWGAGASADYPICAGISNGQPVKDGVWELAIYLFERDDPIFDSSVFVGDDHVPVTVSFDVEADTLCRLYLSPARAEGWGENKLDADYASGDSLELEVASGTYDLHAEDCDGEVVDDREAVEIIEGTTLSVG